MVRYRLLIAVMLYRD